MAGWIFIHRTLLTSTLMTERLLARSQTVAVLAANYAERATSSQDLQSYMLHIHVSKAESAQPCSTSMSSLGHIT